MHYRILFLETGECPFTLRTQWYFRGNGWSESRPNSFSSIESIRSMSRYSDKTKIGIIDLHGVNVDPPTVGDIATYFLDKGPKDTQQCEDAMDDFQFAMNGPLMNQIHGEIFAKLRGLENLKVPDWNPREPEKFQQYNPLVK